MAIKFIKRPDQYATATNQPEIKAVNSGAIYKSPDGHWRPGTYDAYAGAVATHGATSCGILIPPHLHTLRLKRAAELIKANVPKNESIVDIGCGYGAVLDYLPQGLDYTGVEPSPALVAAFKEAHPTYNVLLSGVDDLAAESSVRDWVICLGVATHLLPGTEHLQWYAREIQRFARKGLILEFQGEKYNGQFTSHPIAEVQAAFCQRIKPEDTLMDQEDTTYTCLVRVA